MGRREDLVGFERDFWQAAGDPDFYREHFADDGRCVFGVGILDKEATVASMYGAGEWTDVTFDELSIVGVADDVQALTYEATGTGADGDTYRANVTSVYVRRGGEWQLILHQQTPRI
jgi:hypothetical protein